MFPGPLSLSIEVKTALILKDILNNNRSLCTDITLDVRVWQEIYKLLLNKKSAGI